MSGNRWQTEDKDWLITPSIGGWYDRMARFYTWKLDPAAVQQVTRETKMLDLLVRSIYHQTECFQLHTVATWCTAGKNVDADRPWVQDKHIQTKETYQTHPAHTPSLPSAHCVNSNHGNTDMRAAGKAERVCTPPQVQGYTQITHRDTLIQRLRRHNSWLTFPLLAIIRSRRPFWPAWLMMQFPEA